MEHSRDELRRELRDLERAHEAAEPAHRQLISAALESSPAEATGVVLGMDRRGFFRMGGLAVAATAVLAACREKAAKKQVPISGESPKFKALDTKPVTDTVLLRTASSFEQSLVAAYGYVVANHWLDDDPDFLALVNVFVGHHQAHAQLFIDLTKEAGGTPCTGINAKITGDLFDPLIQRIGNAGDNAHSDAKAFAHALETLAGATHQSFVEPFSQPALRRAAMSVGAVEARHAALLAKLLNPDSFLGTGAASTAPTIDANAGTTTTVPTGIPQPPATSAASTTVAPAAENTFSAIPNTFGSLSQIPLVIGPSTEGTSRKATNLETPSLNSYLYADEAC